MKVFRIFLLFLVTLFFSFDLMAKLPNDIRCLVSTTPCPPQVIKGGLQRFELCRPFPTIGVRDGSDAEFAQSNYVLDFYPNSQPVSQCAKELNLYNHPTQYFHINLCSSQVNSDLAIELIPVWTNGTGPLKIKIEVWNGSSWVEVDSTLGGSYDSGFVEIPRSYLYQGEVSFRLTAVSGTGGTNVVTWDQIKIYPVPQSIIFSIGRNDDSELEFMQEYFYAPLVWDSTTMTASDFPKELNWSVWPEQIIRFNLTGPQSEKPAYLSLDVKWSGPDPGLLHFAIDTWDGSNWVLVKEFELAQGYSNRIEIPAERLKEGVNELRLRIPQADHSTYVAVWDQITLWQRTMMPAPMKELLTEIVNTTLNYWTNPDIYHFSGLPLTAYKVGDLARFGYSTPAEWGYALEAWILAVQFGKATQAEALTRIETVLRTMETLQHSGSGAFAYGVFYPYYTLTTSDGSNVDFPHSDGNVLLPSGDNALLWSSLWVVEGWLRSIQSPIADLAKSVRDQMSFRSFSFENPARGSYLAHQINAETGELSDAVWDVFSDEGGLINFISYLSDSITLDEYKRIHDSQIKRSATWNAHTVELAAKFNPAFVWGERVFAGYPIDRDLRARQYLEYSFLPNFRAHLDWAQARGIDHMGFSDSMSQTSHGQPIVGHYVAPNLDGIEETNIPSYQPNPPEHVQPHGAIMPFIAYGHLEMETLKKIYEHVILLKNDSRGYWHPAGNRDPYGFEVTASPYQDDATYQGADDGRYIFETLSQAYTLFSAAYALEKENSLPTFQDYARQVSDRNYQAKLEESLNYTFQNPKP